MSLRTCSSTLCQFYHKEHQEVKVSLWKPNEKIVYTNHYCFREPEPVLRTTTTNPDDAPTACYAHRPLAPTNPTPIGFTD